MAKPEHTAYQLQADFGDKNSPVMDISEHVGPLAINTSCVKNGVIQTVPSYRNDQKNRLVFATPEHGYVHFGYEKADKMLIAAREIAKSQFTKGTRPSFFLRKLTMSEFMAHDEFSNYKGTDQVRRLYKKYLLLDLMK